MPSLCQSFIDFTIAVYTILGLALNRENAVLYWTEAGDESTPPGIFKSSVDNPEATMVVQLEEGDSPHTITVYKGMVRFLYILSKN